MIQHNSKYTLSNLYYLGILFILAVCTYLAMPDLDNQASAGSGLSFLAFVGLAVLQIPLLIFIIGQRVKAKTDTIRFIPRFMLYYMMYFAWMTLITILMDETHNIIGLITMSLSILVFPFLLSTSYFRARQSRLDIWFYLCIIFIMLCIVVQYKNIYSLANILHEDQSHIVVSYFPLFVLPLLLLPSSRIIRYGSIAITAIIIISSIKRGGIIALGGSLIVYVFIKQIISDKSKLRQMIIIGIILALMGGVLYYITTYTDIDVVERIANISNDGGSDRDVLWLDTYHNIHNRDIGYRMVGNGYRSAQLVSTLRLPAHNDFLEIWYDFGGIGLTFYLIAFFSLCIYTFRLCKRKSRYAPHMAMILTYYFIFSMISIVVLYPWMALFTLSVGIIAGLADREQEENTLKTKDSKHA